jgi:hypothetical protein
MALNDETEAVFKSVRDQEVDPVSGNEVPIGSEPEEVRDDIDAKLSEGEYVVPADVVKYYGVKFFEDLRNEAKLGFAQMQSNGRIGGEPVETDMTELPFPAEDLQMVDDQNPEQAVMNMGGYIRGFNEGGYNPALPEGSTPINTYSSPMGNAFEIKEYINAAGEVMYIQFSGGKPLTPIPEGFTLKGSASQEVAEAVQATPVADNRVNDNRSNDDRTKVGAVPEAIDWDTVDINKFQETAKQYDNPLGKGMLMLMGPFGLIGKLMLSHQKSQIIKAIDKRLENPELENREQWLGVKNNFLDVKNDPSAEDGTTVKKDPMGNTIITGPDGQVVDTSRIGTGSYVDDLLGMDGKWGVQGPGLMDSIKGARKDFPSARPPRDPKGSDGKGFVTSKDGSIIRDGNGKPVKTGRYEQDKPLVPQLREISKKKQKNAVAKKEKDMGTKLSSARTTKDKKETYASKAQRGGGFSKGGLVNKPKKK